MKNPATTARALRGVVALAAPAVLAGCASSPLRPLAPEGDDGSPADRALACAAPNAAPSDTLRQPLRLDAPEGAPIADVRVEGAPHVPAELVLRAVATRAGDRLDRARLDADLARLLAMGAFEDVSAGSELRAGGQIALVLRVSERLLVRHVFFADPALRPASGEWVPPRTGDVYDAAVVAGASRALEQVWVALGYMDAAVSVGARRVAPDREDLCVHASPGDLWTLDRVDFPGAKLVSEADLRATLPTRDGTANLPGKPFRRDILDGAAPAVTALLYDRGLLACVVDPPAIVRVASSHRVRVTIRIEEGPAFKVRDVAIEGALAAPAPDYLEAFGARVGEVFSRAQVLEGIERARSFHFSRTGREAAIEVETTLEPATGEVDLALQLREAR